LNALCALATALLALSPAAQARPTANLSLDVSFSYTGEITVTLPNGTPVGTRGATPSVIPAGYYTIELTQPGCVDVPTFILQGPGVNVQNDLQSGEIVTDAVGVSFQPNATYTWRDGSLNPPMLWTFTTSGDVLGTPPPVVPASQGPVSTNKETNNDVVGSGIARGASSAPAPFRGSLAGAVSAAGALELAFKGKGVTRLTAGRYKVNVADASEARGFLLENASYAASITDAGFVGKRSETVDLTAGKWYFAPSATGHKKAFTVVR
jgi:hypothetical protein